MLQFRQSDTAAQMIFTLNENVTINDPYFLFIFTHVTTKQKVSLVRYSGSDESSNPVRYNQFTINASVIFLNTPIGEWHYKVFEQVSNLNVDELSTGRMLENGKLLLKRSADFNLTKYNQSQSYKVYNG